MTTTTPILNIPVLNTPPNSVNSNTKLENIHQGQISPRSNVLAEKYILACKTLNETIDSNLVRSFKRFRLSSPMLDLSAQHLTDKHIRVLTYLICIGEIPTTKFELSHNAITSEGLIFLLTCGEKGNVPKLPEFDGSETSGIVTHLSCAHNPIRDSILEYLIDCFETPKPSWFLRDLLSLDISNCGLSRNAILSFFLKFPKYYIHSKWFIRLSHLYLGGNQPIRSVSLLHRILSGLFPTLGDQILRPKVAVRRHHKPLPTFIHSDNFPLETLVLPVQGNALILYSRVCLKILALKLSHNAKLKLQKLVAQKLRDEASGLIDEQPTEAEPTFVESEAYQQSPIEQIVQIYLSKSRNAPPMPSKLPDSLTHSKFMFPNLSRADIWSILWACGFNVERAIPVLDAKEKQSRERYSSQASAMSVPLSPRGKRANSSVTFPNLSTRNIVTSLAFGSGTSGTESTVSVSGSDSGKDGSISTSSIPSIPSLSISNNGYSLDSSQLFSGDNVTDNHPHHGIKGPVDEESPEHSPEHSPETSPRSHSITTPLNPAILSFDPDVQLSQLEDLEKKLGAPTDSDPAFYSVEQDPADIMSLMLIRKILDKDRALLAELQAIHVENDAKSVAVIKELLNYDANKRQIDSDNAERLTREFLYREWALAQRKLEEKTILCMICFCDCTSDELYIIDGCYHKFCTTCMMGYLKLKIYDNKVQRIPCPHPDCSQTIDYHQIQQIVDEETMKTYDERLRDVVLNADPNTKWCPKGCGNALIGSKESPMLICFQCQFAFCFNCNGVAWHSDSTCGQYQAFLRDNPGIDDAFGAWARANSKKCPRCTHCPPGEQYFCWVCSEPLSASDPYAHFRAGSGSECANKLYS